MRRNPYDNRMPLRPTSISQSILDFTAELVRISSRGGIDPYEPVLSSIQNWLSSHDVRARTLNLPNGRSIAVVADVGQPGRGPRYLLNAPADTADFGDESDWSCNPLEAVIRDGWLYGRGCSDSKAGISIFCHIAVALNAIADRLKGSITLVFDTEEHTGTFLGIRRFFETDAQPSEIAAALIGYPGQDRIIVGCRGFYRAIIRVHGKAAHSGSSRSRGVNAISRAVTLVEKLQRLKLPTTQLATFPLPPQITITELIGGHGFSAVPDLCTMNVDVRLTPTFKMEQARDLLIDSARELDTEGTCPRQTEVEPLGGFDAYVLDASAPVVRALQMSAQRVLGHAIPTSVAGPSSIGNYLSSLDIPATSGFGVIYRNLHAADECIAVESIVPAYRSYYEALEYLLGVDHAAYS
jgi:succinyl-diaminopimelate desuccinylase